MKRLRLSFVACLLFCFSAFFSSCWADVVYTDEQHQELTEIMNQLETLNNEQQTTIESLQKRNEQLQNDSKSKQQILEKQQTIIEQQQSLLQEEKKSSIKQKAEVGLVCAFLGILIGILL